jgi:small conductance mechanosensitive channel
MYFPWDVGRGDVGRAKPILTMSLFETAREYFVAHKEVVITYATRLLSALLIMLLGVVAAKLSRRWLKAVLNRSRVRDDALLKNFFLRTFSVSIIIAATLLALDTLSLPIPSLVAGLGITGLILGFGLRDTLSNFAAGLLLLIYRPFRAGELIEVEGSTGVVEELTIVNMQMTTTDGVRVIMPNSRVWGAKIVNHSLSKRRRFELTLKVREDDAEHAIMTIQAALADDARVLGTPPPQIRVTSLEDNTATLIVWAWTSPEDFHSVTADEYLRVLSHLREAELQIV